MFGGFKDLSFFFVSQLKIGECRVVNPDLVLCFLLLFSVLCTTLPKKWSVV